MIWLGSGGVAWGNEAQCVRYYRSKKILKAADCFASLAQRLARKSSPRQRIMRGRALRNAASLLARMARTTPTLADAAWLRERAVRQLRLYLREKLYELSEHQKRATQQMHKLERLIRYGHLTIVSQDANASLLIQGHKTKISTTGQWSRRVRPGTYVVISMGPLGEKRRRVTVAPGGAKVIVFAPPQNAVLPDSRGLSRTRDLISWTLFAGGGVLALGGIIFLGTAEGIDQTKVQLNLKLLAESTMSPNQRLRGAREVQALQAQAQSMYAVGWTVVCLGLLAAVGGGLVRWWPRPAPTPAPLPKAARGVVPTAPTAHESAPTQTILLVP